jgi:integrase
MPQCGDSSGDSDVKGLITMAKITAKGLEKLIREMVPKRTPLGDGLYFTITKGGSASFAYRYQIKGKRRQIGLGAYRPVTNTLAIARFNALSKQTMVREGIDPIEKVLNEQIQEQTNYLADQIAKTKDQATFEKVALEYIDSKKPEWKNVKHHQQWINTLRTYAFPTLGKIPVADIDTPQILTVLKPIWNTKTETATRVRTRLEAVLSYAEAHEWRDGGNPARWRGHLSAILPSPQKIKHRKHHSALPYGELPPFMTVLSNTDGMGARALEMTILTATRTKESLGALWGEFDLDKRVWTIPKERMKAGVEHRIPLSGHAMKIITKLAMYRISDYVFPNHSNGKPLSNAGMSSVLKRLDRTDITVHGFRSTFRDYVAEKTATPERTAEAALAHKLKDASEAAYQRGDLIQKREILMQLWADYCYPSGAKVIQMPTVKSVS